MTIYGFGSVGQQIVDELIAHEFEIEMILDRGKGGQTYRGIPIMTLEDASDGRLSGRSVLVGLHNHYVDVNRLHADLIAAGAASVLTPINLPQLIEAPRTRAGYWLDPDFDYSAHEADFARVRSLLHDETSRELLDAILRYRRGGNLADCPAPSLQDEYTPLDLPRFAAPLRMIDCGAYTGVAIHKFLKADYAIDSFVAFEPDPANFATLAGRSFPVRRAVCLPLATWSSTTQLKFGNIIPGVTYLSDDRNITVQGSGASCLSEDGTSTVQCVAVDDVLHGEAVNLIKLDVEGAEIETLQGMERIIRDQRPNLLVSAYHTPGHLYEIAHLIDGWQLGYRFHLRVHEYNTFGIVLYCLRDELLDADD